MTEQKTPIELLPCPFCNGSNIVVIEREDKCHPDAVYSMAQCGDCLTEGPLSLDYIQAQEKWNRRAESTDLDAALAAIKRRDEVIARAINCLRSHHMSRKGISTLVGFMEQDFVAAKLKGE